MQVKLLDSTVDPLFVISMAARTCYASRKKDTVQSRAEFVKGLIKAGHETPLEFASATFDITGISISCQNQMVRHRHASFCVSGDTRISTSSNKTNKKTISELFNLPKQYQNMLQVRCVDEKTGVLGYDSVAGIYKNGIKDVFLVKTDLGYKVKTTADHQFLTVEGWKRLQDIKIGEKVYTNGQELYKNKEWLKGKYIDQNLRQVDIAALCGVSSHTIRAWVRKLKLQKPCRFKIGHIPHNKGLNKYNYQPLQRVSEKRKGKSYYTPPSQEKSPFWKGLKATNSAGYNRIFKNFIKTHKCSLCGFEGITEIHHKDKNPANSEKDNLIELCVSCHKAMHKSDVKKGIRPSKIVSIEYCGKEVVYDLSMAGKHKNFIGNGFVLHNCVQSGRYVDQRENDCIIPYGLLSVYEGAEDYVKEAKELYKKLVINGVKCEDARALLPQGMATNMCVNMNFRTIRHFLKLRLPSTAQDEVRQVAREIYNICQEKWPWLITGLEDL